MLRASPVVFAHTSIRLCAQSVEERGPLQSQAQNFSCIVKVLLSSTPQGGSRADQAVPKAGLEPLNKCLNMKHRLVV